MEPQLEALIADLLAELQTSQRVAPFAQRAQAEGLPNVARLLRAVAVSETYRAALLRQGLAAKVDLAVDYFVCPHCGLIYAQELPEVCLIDDTPGSKFEKVQ